jgi:hypothetical protein
MNGNGNSSPGVQAVPLYSRNAIWSYVNVVRGPVMGPQPRLAAGTGKTASGTSLPGNAPMLPGYLTDNEYFPVLYEYDIDFQPSFELAIPKTINTGIDGFTLVGTYRAHDFTPGQRQLQHMRQGASWQEMAYPPNVRNLLAWQQVQRYRVNSLTMQARPLATSNYFLGYQVTPQVQASIGQTTLGVMGSQ